MYYNKLNDIPNNFYLFTDPGRAIIYMAPPVNPLRQQLSDILHREHRSLKALWQHLNNMLFDGELKDIPIRYAKKTDKLKFEFHARFDYEKDTNFSRILIHPNRRRKPEAHLISVMLVSHF